MEGEGYLVAKQKCFHIVNSDTTYIACRKMNVSFSPFSFSFVLFPLRRFFFFFPPFRRNGRRTGTRVERRSIIINADDMSIVKLPRAVIDKAKGRGSRLRRTWCAEDVN